MRLFLLCGKASESLAHVLSGWSALARNRHIASFKVLFFEMLTNLRLADAPVAEQSGSKIHPS